MYEGINSVPSLYKGAERSFPMGYFLVSGVPYILRENPWHIQYQLRLKIPDICFRRVDAQPTKLLARRPFKTKWYKIPSARKRRLARALTIRWGEAVILPSTIDSIVNMVLWVNSTRNSCAAWESRIKMNSLPDLVKILIWHRLDWERVQSILTLRSSRISGNDSLFAKS